MDRLWDFIVQWPRLVELGALFYLVGTLIALLKLHKEPQLSGLKNTILLFRTWLQFFTTILGGLGGIILVVGFYYCFGEKSTNNVDSLLFFSFVVYWFTTCLWILFVVDVVFSKILISFFHLEISKTPNPRPPL